VRIAARIRVCLVLPVSAVAVIAAGCGSEPPAARVAGVPIASERVEQTLQHARDEARREGRSFPKDATRAYAAMGRQALDLLVYHEELRQKAAQLGVVVSDGEIEARLGADEEQADGEGAGEEDDAFVRESIRGALLYQRIFDRVTAGVRVTERDIAAYYRTHASALSGRGLSLRKAGPEIARDLRATRRNAVMARWVARMRREFTGKVVYRNGAA